LTLKEIEQVTITAAKAFDLDVMCYQSNHEGDLIDILQAQTDQCVGIIINAGAFTHYSYALHDAILDTQLPAVEVHLSNLAEREAWRQQSVITPSCLKVISGKKEKGYQEAVAFLAEVIKS